MKPFDLMIAPTGARLGKADHPALPLSEAEIVQTAIACEAAGATAIHLHIRDAYGQHSLDPDRYNSAISAVQAATNLHIQISTEAAEIFDVKAQIDCLSKVTATDASIAIREIARDPDAIQSTYAMTAERGISIQHILYDANDLRQLLHHFDTGTIATPDRRAIFVLGRYSAGQRSTPADLTPFLETLGQTPLKWSVCAFGPAEHACLLAGLKAGGQVRLGFENNRQMPDGSPYKDNAASVAAFVETAAKAGFTPNQTPGKVTP